MPTNPKQEFFVCLELSRPDIAFLGYKNTNRLSDDTMVQLARQTCDNDAVMDAWWLALEHACERAGLTKMKGQ